jgi:hypothetical protein
MTKSEKLHLRVCDTERDLYGMVERSRPTMTASRKRDLVIVLDQLYKQYLACINAIPVVEE